MTSLAGARLRMELDRVPLWRGDQVAIKQLVEDFARYLYLPRIKEPAVLVDAIRDGLSLLTFTCRGRLRQLTSRSDWSAGSTVHVRGGQWSPETLLVAAAVDCFVLTFRAIAAASKLPWERLSCNGEGTPDRVDGVTRFTALALT